MRTSTTIALAVLRISGLIQIALGLLFWTGNAPSLISLHMLIGFLLVLSLWFLALLAARAGIAPSGVALAFLWGLIVPIVGLTQARLLPGDSHWVSRSLISFSASAPSARVKVWQLGSGRKTAAHHPRQQSPS